MNIGSAMPAGDRASLPLATEWWRPVTAAQDRAAVPGRAAFVALVVYTVVLVAAPQEFVRSLGPLRLAFVAAAIAIAAHIADRFAGRLRTPPWPRELLLVLGLLLWAVATLPFSYWPSGSVGVLGNLYLKSVAVFVLLAGVVDSVKRLRLLTVVLVSCAAIIAVTAIRHFLTGTLMDGAPDRIAGYGTSGMAGNPNDLALLLNIIIPLNAALIAVSRGWGVRVLASLVLLVSIAGVIVTFSRAGFITLAVIGALGLWQLVRRGAVGWLAALVVAGVLLGALAPGHYADRLSTVWNMDADTTGSAQDRWRDTVVAASFAVQHPLLGAGIGMDFLALNQERGAVWLSVHNAYLNYAVDLGLVGLSLFLAVFVSAWAGARRVARQAARESDAELRAFATAVWISLTGFAVAAFFHPVAYHAFFYYLAGLAVAVRNIHRIQGVRP